MPDSGRSERGVYGYAQEEGGTDRWAKEKYAARLLSEVRTADHGRGIGYKNAVNYPEEEPVSRFYCEVRALRCCNRGNQN